MVACSAQSGASDGYTLSEWVIDGPDRLATTDAAAITVSNTGEWGHTLVVTTESGEVVGATGLVGPGEAATLQLDIAAGAYTFSCRIVAQDDEGNLSDHYERGMYRSVTVTG